MIFFSGFLLLIVSIFIRAVLKVMGRYDVFHDRPTDWLVAVPFFAGLGCMLWSFGVLASRYLP